MTRGGAILDWIDEADGVFRGGGVKGLGLAGALIGFAQHPEKPVHRWVNVAGASAGAIIACYLAAGHDADDIAGLMTRTRFGDFQDFPPPGKLIGGSLNLLRTARARTRGRLRAGSARELDAKTFASVKTDDGKRSRLKLIACRRHEPGAPCSCRTTCPATATRREEPIDPDQFEIADAARMSMSIPYFFEPVVLARDRVFVETPAAPTDHDQGQPADRIDVEQANEAARYLGRRRGRVSRTDRQRS